MSVRPGDVRPFARLPGGLAPLGYRNFGLFWIGHAVSNTGRWMELTGAVWLVYERTGSPVLLGLIGICRAVPAFALSSIAGVVVDRVDQRKLLVATQTLGLLASLGLGLLVATGQVQFWHVYVQVALQAAITSFDASVRQALFPRLVPRTHLAEAVTMYSTSARLSGLIGPAVGGLAIARLGEAWPFLLNAASFVMLIAIASILRGVIARTARQGSTFRGELSEGLRYIRGAPVLMGLLQMEIVFGLFNMNPVMITIIGRDVLSVGPEGLGGLLSAPAIGALAGTAGLLIFGQARRQGRFVILSTFVYSASLIAFTMSRSYALAFAALALIGLLDSVVNVTRQNVVQLASPGRMRGRVIGNFATVTRGLGPLGQTQSGLVAGAIGGPLAVVCAAGLLALAAAASARSSPALWTYSRDVAAPSVKE